MLNKRSVKKNKLVRNKTNKYLKHKGGKFALPPSHQLGPGAGGPGPGAPGVGPGPGLGPGLGPGPGPGPAHNNLINIFNDYINYIDEVITFLNSEMSKIFVKYQHNLNILQIFNFYYAEYHGKISILFLLKNEILSLSYIFVNPILNHIQLNKNLKNINNLKEIIENMIQNNHNDINSLNEYLSENVDYMSISPLEKDNVFFNFEMVSIKFNKIKMFLGDIEILVKLEINKEEALSSDKLYLQNIFFDSCIDGDYFTVFFILDKLSDEMKNEFVNLRVNMLNNNNNNMDVNNEIDNNIDFTPLHYVACRNKRSPIINLDTQQVSGIMSPYDYSDKDNFNKVEAPLLYDYYYKIAELLIDNNCEINAKTSISEVGITPLHLACEYNNNDMIELLLKNGSNLLESYDNNINPCKDDIEVCSNNIENVNRLIQKYYPNLNILSQPKYNYSNLLVLYGQS